ncbi:MAG: cytochrome P450, partial [Gammaproteobacteria bacterium]|nr:cytochrome P450 [Phycisphaerae bacterium]NIQ12628.1 cytochrome P450 [Gammaproteobacteria bacterium]NIW50588.1 cytochrome P450 [Gammaproteobacteria bacterium]NIX32730.1 cytochrome P450 [Phycisphaerae bacterium]
NLRPAIHDIIDHLLAEYENQHEMNLVEAISYPLPIMVISEMLGVPKEDWHIIRQYASGLAGVFEQLRTQQDIDDGNKLVVQMKQYFRELIEKKKQQPADDLLTGLIAVYEEQEQVFTMDELLSNLILLVWAGHETTSNLISNAIFELLTHPAQYAQL